MQENLTTDVVVIGAGLAGLTAAYDLTRRGIAVVVVEASDRIGGRVRDVVLSTGGSAELGAQWVGPEHHELRSLVHELGIDLVPVSTSGSNVFVEDGTTTPFAGRIPESMATRAAILDATATLDRLAASLKTDQAALLALDAQTAQGWLRAHVSAPVEQALAYVVRTELCAEPSQVSAAALLDLYSDLASDRLLRDSETDRVAGGPERIAHALAGVLTEPVRLGQQAVFIERRPGASAGSDVVRVHVTGSADSQVTDFGGDFTVDARAAVLAVPSAAVTRIRWAPALPGWLDQGLQRRPMGAVIKAALEYPEPFWQSVGRSGSVILADGDVASIIESTPDGGRGGVLHAFVVGDAVHRVSRMPVDERHRVLVAAAVSALGAAAAAPLAIHEALWAEEPHVRGGYGPYSPPGLEELVLPVSVPGHRVFLAGSDLTTVNEGYMDGAVHSGHAAALHVVALFTP